MDSPAARPPLSDPFACAPTADPEAPALVHRGIVLSRARVAADAARIAARLGQRGIGPGDIVAVHLNTPVTHWMVTLGLLRLGAVSLSLTSNARNELAALPGIVAVVSAPGEEDRYPETLWRLAVSPDWLDGPTPPPETLPATEDADRRAGRICFTSGTSGHPKAVLLDAARLSARLAGTPRRAGLHPGATLWCGLGADTAFGYTATLATWRVGGCVFLSSGGSGAFAGMHARGVDRMIASPAAFEPLLRDAALSGLPPRDGRAVVAGGRLTAALRDRIRDGVCREVQVAYGSSEAGGITLGDAAALDSHPGRVGAVFDDVEVRVVGAAGQPVPASAEGRLEIRSDSMADGYLNDPGATAEVFRGGWFRPGDIATLSENGALTLLGRTKQILNIGGVKLPVEELEERLRALPGVDDVCALLLSPGNDEQNLALVLAGAPDALGAIAGEVRASLSRLGTVHLFATPSLPRGSMGKIRKQEVTDAVRAALAEPPAAEGQDLIPLPLGDPPRART